MRHDDPLRKVRPDADGADDIEILEVVGLDEDGAPVADTEAVDEEVDLIFESDALDAPPEPEPPRATDGAPQNERVLRLQADFENYKKRIERERVEHLRYATATLLQRLLPVLDNFDRAMASARGAGVADPLLDGVLLIQRQLLDEMKKEGLRPMESIGQIFDPRVHEAVATDDTTSAPPHTVTAVFQRGYTLHERVLRPALVRVRVDGPATGGDPASGKES